MSKRMTEKKRREKENKETEDELLDLINQTSIINGEKSLYYQNILTSKKNLGLSKKAILASITTKLSNLVEENIKYKIEQLGPNWKNFIQKPSPDLFEALKQIIFHLGLPKNVEYQKLLSKAEKARKESSSSSSSQTLTWKITKNNFGISPPGLDIFSEGNLFEKSSHSTIFNLYQNPNFKYIVKYTPSAPIQEVTSLQFYFPTPSDHHLRTIRTLLKKIYFQNIDKKPILKVFATTFYECWIKAYLACLVASYKLFRSDLQIGEVERNLLQTMNIPHFRVLLLKQIALEVQLYQMIGSKYEKIQSKEEEKGEEKKETLGKKQEEEKQKEKEHSGLSIEKETNEDLLFKRGEKLAKSIKQLKSLKRTTSTSR